MAYRRSNYIINPKFQLKFCLFVTSLVFLSSLIFPWSIVEIVEHIQVNYFQGNPALEHAAKKISEIKSDIVVWLIIYEMVFLLLVIIICIFQSHKIAGPLFKLKKHLSHIKEGNSPEQLFFRKGDNFKDLAEEFNEAFRVVKENQVKDLTYLNEVSNYLNTLSDDVPEDKKAGLIEIKQKLADIQRRYES